MLAVLASRILYGPGAISVEIHGEGIRAREIVRSRTGRIRSSKWHAAPRIKRGGVLITCRLSGARRSRGTEMSELIQVSGCANPARAGDVIFVHGLDGDARGTWQPAGLAGPAWPDWLGQDLPDVGVWLLGYEVASSAWKGHSMPLADRATNVLGLLDIEGLGERPLVFVTHSLGGLLVKQVLRHAPTTATCGGDRSPSGPGAWCSCRRRTRARTSPTGSSTWAFCSATRSRSRSSRRTTRGCAS